MATKEELLKRLEEVLIENEYPKWAIDIYMDAGTYCTVEALEEYIALEESGFGDDGDA